MSARNSTSLLGCLVLIAIFALAFSIGPMCFAYDLRHLVPLITHAPVDVRWTQWPIFIAGVVLSEVAVPVFFLVWILVLIGVLS